MSGRIVFIGNIFACMALECVRFPKNGETLSAHHFHFWVGGKAAVMANTAAKMGSQVTLLSIVGEDIMGDLVLSHLAGQAVDISHVFRSTKYPTFCQNYFLNAQGRARATTYSRANTTEFIKYLKLKKSVIESADLVVISGEMPVSSMEYAITVASEAGKTIILDPATDIICCHPFINKVDYFLLTEEQLAGIADSPLCDMSKDDLISKANEIRALGSKKLIVKMGLVGAMYLTNGIQKVWRPRVLRRWDMTVNGDFFSGAFARGLALGFTDLSAGRYAAIVAALTEAPMNRPFILPKSKDVDRVFKPRQPKQWQRVQFDFTLPLPETGGKA
jgi:ribokinase